MKHHEDYDFRTVEPPHYYTNADVLALCEIIHPGADDQHRQAGCPEAWAVLDAGYRPSPAHQEPAHNDIEGHRYYIHENAHSYGLIVERNAALAHVYRVWVQPTHDKDGRWTSLPYMFEPSAWEYAARYLRKW